MGSTGLGGVFLPFTRESIFLKGHLWLDVVRSRRSAAPPILAQAEDWECRRVDDVPQLAGVSGAVITQLSHVTHMGIAKKTHTCSILHGNARVIQAHLAVIFLLKSVYVYVYNMVYTRTILLRFRCCGPMS